MRTVAVIAIVWGVAMLAGHTQGAAGMAHVATSGDPCPPIGDRVVERNKYLVVSTERLSEGESKTGVYDLCVRAGREKGAGQGLGEYSHPESISLRGKTAAYSDTTCDVVTGECDVYVDVIAFGISSGSVVAAPYPQPFVTQTAIAPDRSLAWITCHTRSGEVGPFEPTSPRCLRGDRRRNVWVASAQDLRTRAERRTLLAQGDGIKARSLRISRGRVYWTQKGKRRSAPLPN